MLRSIFKYISSGNKTRYIVLSFTREESPYVPKIFNATSPAYGPVHVASTCIIGSNYKVPIPINIIKVNEVEASSICSFNWITAVIDIRVYIEFVHSTCSVHELPEAG